MTDWPDAEIVMAGLCKEFGKVYAQLPEKPPYPSILVRRAAGHDDGITDFPSVDVTVLSTTRKESWQIAEKIRQKVLASARTVVNGALVDNAVTQQPHQQIPEEEKTVTNVTTTYRLALRRPRTGK